MRHPITGRRISREKYAEEEAAFAKRISEMKAEEQTKEQEALAKYRVKSAAMVHKASGDPAEQVCKDGQARHTRDTWLGLPHPPDFEKY